MLKTCGRFADDLTKVQAKDENERTFYSCESMYIVFLLFPILTCMYKNVKSQLSEI